MKKELRVGILGVGTVGQGVVRLVQSRLRDIERRTGVRVKLVAAAVRDLSKSRDCDLSEISLGTDPLEIAKRDDLDLVIELMGGIEDAKEAIMVALSSGKHVITANKALIAEKGNEIIAKAIECNRVIHFEAAIAGGIPIVKAVKEGLAANCILSITGIINGTCNFILSQMTQENCSFDEALQEAKALGYAEADPTFDINGQDARHKLTILASLAFGIPLAYEHVYQEGIENIELQDIKYAEQLGYKLKHLGVARNTEKGVELGVHPALVKSDSMISKVDGVMNALEIVGDAVGPTMFYGAGAGSMPTASSVVADLIELARTCNMDSSERVPMLAFHTSDLETNLIAENPEYRFANYLRFAAEDKPGTLADVTRIFGDLGISIEAMLQKEPGKGEAYVPVVFVTQITSQATMQQAIQMLEKLPTIKGKVHRIRLCHHG